MTAAKLRIDITQGIVEAEGDAQFVLEVYRDFKEKIGSIPTASQRETPTAPPSSARIEVPPTTPAPGKRRKKRVVATNGDEPRAKKKGRESLAIVRDLDLSGSKAGRLKDYYATFAPKTNFERNLIFIYFMQEKMGVSKITEEHIFTCYRDLQLRIPKALRQSLFDTAGDRGWIATSDMSDIKATVHGINYLEHDLQRASAAQ